MNIVIQAIILGAIQGVTEFVPVSSSGHLVIIHDAFNNEALNTLAFDVSLHLGTLLALIIYFYRDLANYIRSGFISLRDWKVGRDETQTMAWMLLASTIPAGLVGYFFEDMIDHVFRDVMTVVIMLIIGAILFFVVERWGRRMRPIQQMTWKDVSVIACAQVLALIPGMSRSGITITAGMALHLTREAAARFSFLMSVPIIAVAGAKKAFDLAATGVVGDVMGIYGIGVLAAALFGYAAIASMLKFVQRFSLRTFAWYRLILASLILVIVFLS